MATHPLNARAFGKSNIDGILEYKNEVALKGFENKHGQGQWGQTQLNYIM